MTLAVVAAALLVFAALSRAWMHNPRLGISFGPRGCVNCCYLAGDTSDGCAMSNAAFVDSMRAIAKEMWGTDDRKHTSGAFAPMGWVTCVSCALGALALLVTSVLALTRRRPQLPVSPASVALLALMTALITGCAFVATKPGPAGFVGIAPGFIAFGIGAVVGIAAAQLLAKLIRPTDPDMLDGAMDPDQF
ncbi:MAG: hypothetical protein SFX73_13665 [Kofleriaceae bacterium]|nr:hypothetical protein [Kofleriaceae bacterium]